MDTDFLLAPQGKESTRYISTLRDPTQTYLESPWTLWLVNKSISPNKTWLQNIHPIATFSTIQQFWGTYNSLKPPSELPTYWEYALFRGGLGRRVIIPDWDDHENVGGGVMQMTGFNLETKTIDHLWRDICLKVIEEAWIHISDFITGIMISTKSSTTRYYVWVGSCKEHIWETVRDRIEGVFAQDCRTPLKWTPHGDRIERKVMDSSYKVIVKPRLSRSTRLFETKCQTSASHFRSRSLGYCRNKLDVNANVATKRRTWTLLLEPKPAYAKKLSVAIKEPLSIVTHRGVTAAQLTSPFLCSIPRRGRSCHGGWQGLEYPVFNKGHGDHGRCQGNGDFDTSGCRFFCASEASQYSLSGKDFSLIGIQRGMMDASTQFSAKTGNFGNDRKFTVA